MRNVVQLLVVAMVAVSFVACGNEDDNPDGASGGTTPVRAADMDVASGCWNAADRDKGGSDNVGHQQWKTPPAMAIDPAKKYTATIETNKGSFEVELYAGDAPKTVNNFVCLAKAGYYDGTPFHRIIDGFMFQGGDPTGTGSGGPGYRFEDEPIKRDYVKGTLAMANAGPNTNGSQFFVCLSDLTKTGSLAKNYTLFGQVTSGMDIVEKIGKTPTTMRGREQSQPTEPVTLERVTIHEA